MPRIFLAHECFDTTTCRRIRLAMDRGTADPAEVLHDTIHRKDDVRRASSIEVEAVVLDEVERRLDEQRDAISAFYGLALAEREGPGFLRYADGGFYRAHYDRAAIESWPGAARRQVAVVVFLNSSREANSSAAFTGGALRLFVDDIPLEIHPVEGLLAAFPADILHEVTVVRGAPRDTIVDWFY